jgi:hypothetical protein
MTPRSAMTAPSPAALRMRRSRERRRQGDIIVKLDVGANMAADLVALGWVPAPDRVDKDTLAPRASRAYRSGDHDACNPVDDRIGGCLLRAVARNPGADCNWI